MDNSAAGVWRMLSCPFGIGPPLAALACEVVATAQH